MPRIASLLTLLITALLVATQAQPSAAQEAASDTPSVALRVLDEVMAIPAKQIPTGLLREAEGVAIVPGVVKGGFIVGVRHGRGVVLVRDEQRRWQLPTLISLTGGSIGWQVGVQSTDVILVFKTRKSVDNLLRGKFTVGADAAVAAGPVGREAAAATDANLKAEIYSYSRSRGLFAGVSLDGSSLAIDQDAQNAYYRPIQVAPGQPPAVPPSAIRLVERIAFYTDGQLPPGAQPAPGAPVQGGPPGEPPFQPAAQQPVADIEGARRDLGQSYLQLEPLLDESWRKFLAPPGEIFTGGVQPTLDSVDVLAQRYDLVARDPKFRALAQKRQFITAYNALQRYATLLNSLGDVGPVDLPPPPRAR